MKGTDAHGMVSDPNVGLATCWLHITELVSETANILRSINLKFQIIWRWKEFVDGRQRNLSMLSFRDLR